MSGASFSAKPGEILALIGKNGAGKSTLLSILAAVLRPDSGRVLLGGRDPFSSPSAARRIGLVPQTDSLFPELSVRDNLRFWLSAAGLNPAEVASSPAVALLGVEGFLKKRVDTLSGGMRRRAAICAALLHNPDLLLLDEPFTGLDLVYKLELKTCLLRLAQAGKIIVYIAHHPDELLGLCGRVLVLSRATLYLQDPSILFEEGRPAEDILLKMIKGDGST